MAIPKRTVLFLSGYVAFLAILALIGYFVRGQAHVAKATYTSGSMHYSASDIGYYSLPRISMTMGAPDGKAGHKVTLDLALEVDRHDEQRIGDYQPRLSSQLLEYTRSQDLDYLTQPYNQNAFRRGLLEVARKTNTPVPIFDVLIRRLIVS